MDIQSYFNWLISHWYLILIGLMGFGLILAIMKILQINKKREYFSEIKEHHELMNREFLFNPSSYKWLYRKGKKLAKINSISKKIKEIKTKIKKKDETGKIIEEIEIRPMLFYKLDVSPKSKFFMWTGHEHLTLPEDFINFDYEHSRIEVRNDIDFEYYKGYFTSPEQESKVFTDMEFFRTLRDKDIDGVGYQAKRYSEVRDEWAHDVSMKEKEIEKLKEEKKLAGTKAR